MGNRLGTGRISKVARPVTIRLTENRDDRKIGYKRCEHLRPVTIFDGDEWDRLYSIRPRAESLNRWIKKHFSDKRAPAVGIPRNLFMLFCIGQLNNAKAMDVTRQSANKVLAKAQADGVVCVGRGRIDVLDPDAVTRKAR